MACVNESPDLPFTYLPPDRDTKAMVKYLSKKPIPDHKIELEKRLLSHGFKLTNISENKIEAEKVQCAVSDGDFEFCINGFMSDFPVYIEKFKNCSKADDFHIGSLLKNYASKCCRNWFEDTSTLRVIGPKHVVEEITKLVQEHFKGRLSHDAESTSQKNGKAEPFDFDEIHHAILKFVMKQSKLSGEMKNVMRCIGYVEIKSKQNKFLSVEVLPNEKSKDWPHEAFRSSSKEVLKGFFGKFDTWKEVFDPNVFAGVTAPHLFQNKSSPTLHVKWYSDNHVMLVTGESSYVQEYKNKVEHALQNAQAAMGQQSHSRRVGSASSVTRPTYSNSPPYGKSSTRPKTAAPNFRYHSKPKTTSIVFDETEDIPGGVLKFAFSDPTSHTELEKCCGESVRVHIKNETGKINIYVIFKDQTYTYQAKEKSFSAIKEYLSKFTTKNLNCDETKLAQVKQRSPDLFSGKPGSVHIKDFPKTVKITGLVDKVEEREKEIRYELSVEIEEETPPVDIFIAQRECDVWVRAQDFCNSSGHNISITSPCLGKIQYKGETSAIKEAQNTVETLTKKLIDQRIDRLSTVQEEFLKQYLALQQDFGKENKLDAVYKLLKDSGTKGALRISESAIHLVCVNEADWQRANTALISCINNFEVALNGGKHDIPSMKICRSLDTKLKESMPMVLVKQKGPKKATVYCLSHEMAAIKQRVKEILDEISEIAPVKKFYPLKSKNMTTHIHDWHKSKIREANSVEMEQKDGSWGLSVTCETECLDFVDISFEALKTEIVMEEKTIAGYALLGWLEKNPQHIAIGKENSCSIFLAENEKGEKKTETSSQVFTVKTGDIMNESCDAIVNSTGGYQFSSNQVSRALEKKYGSDTLKTISSSGQKWTIPNQACCYPVHSSLPWNYIINISTPSSEKELKDFLNLLLQQADAHGIKSLAMPTIGTGNMGMDYTIVANCMKEVFHSFTATSFVHLKDVRVVVYDTSLFSVYKDIVPMKDAIEQSSGGIRVEIYGNNRDSVRRALEKLEKKIADNQRTAVIEDASICGFTDYVTSQAIEICQKHGVQLTCAGAKQLRLQGLTEYVNEAEADIKKLLEPDYPSSWSKMTPGRDFEKILLNVGSLEYNKVETKFKESSPSYSRIIKIERIQIPSSYKLFKTMKDNKITELKTSAITRNLFHGTTVDKVDKILIDKFDRNFAGVNGTVYGRGVYFAVNSSYSVGYARDHQEKCMFLAEVITGDYTQGNSQYKAPPPKPNGKLYDSLVDNMQSPTIFVVFHDDSVYPHYLITFQ